jgi:hypothetical protein
VKRDSDTATLDHIRRVVAACSPAGTPAARLDRDAERLRALVDGLASHLVGQYPAVTAQDARAIVASELEWMAR